MKRTEKYVTPRVLYDVAYQTAAIIASSFNAEIAREVGESTLTYDSFNTFEVSDWE